MSKKKRVILTKGVVESAEVEPEEVKQGVITKLMKVITIERRPEQKIAWIELKVEAGIYNIHIDEATVRAMVAVFDEPSQPTIEETTAGLETR